MTILSDQNWCASVWSRRAVQENLILCKKLCCEHRKCVVRQRNETWQWWYSSPCPKDPLYIWENKLVKKLVSENLPVCNHIHKSVTKGRKGCFDKFVLIDSNILQMLLTWLYTVLQIFWSRRLNYQDFVHGTWWCISDWRLKNINGNKKNGLERHWLLLY